MRFKHLLTLTIALGCRSRTTSDRMTNLAVDAAAGDSLARYNLAVELYRGDSLARDYTKAATLWKQAMEQGSVDATNNYAYLLYYGLGISPDQARAVSLWKQAAALGQPESHFHLGDAALSGAGMRADTAEAVGRYQAAITLAQQSHDSVDGLIANDAKKALARVPPLRTRDRLRADSLARLYGRTSTRTHP